MPSKDGWVDYTIQEADGGWAWSTRDYFGRPRSSGLASTRAIAAAMVIREIARLADACASAADDRQAA